MTDPTWPPATPDEMILWQELHGSDSSIAAAAGVSDYTVATARRGFGLPSAAHPNSARNHDHAVRAPINETRRLDSLYKGRTYG